MRISIFGEWGYFVLGLLLASVVIWQACQTNNLDDRIAVLEATNDQLLR